MRVCNECNKNMQEGYVIEGGEAYYCSDECLEKNISREDYEALYNDGWGDSYYSEWYDEDDEDEIFEFCDVCGIIMDKRKDEHYYVETEKGAQVYCENHYLQQ